MTTSNVFEKSSNQYKSYAKREKIKIKEKKIITMIKKNCNANRKDFLIALQSQWSLVINEIIDINNNEK